MPLPTVLLLLTLLQAVLVNSFSNIGSGHSSASNGHLAKSLLSNALRTDSRKEKRDGAFPDTMSSLTTSSTSLNVISSSPKSRKASGETLSALRERVWQGLQKVSHNLATLKLPATTIFDTLLPFLRQYWWLSPMSLAIIPLYCAIVKGTCAAMPEWWNVVPMEHIAASANAPWIIGHFLASNLAYFSSGAYLMLKRFPLIRRMKKRSGGGIKIRLTKFSMLGVWIFLAGTISTVFHSVQALGSYPLAQSLCYLDHGVAFSAFCYFVETCGLPSRRVLSVGGAALTTLCVTSPGYTFLHSSWHYLSAATATLWALEGYKRLLPSRTTKDKQ